MTNELGAARLAAKIEAALPDAVLAHDEDDVRVRPEAVEEVARLLKEDRDLDFAFLAAITAVDYVEYFEVVYHLLSMRRNQRAVVKTRCYDREEPTLPSVTSVWRGADLQEREVWDLMGVRFEGHPNMKRVLLWEDFPGHPLRKDYLR